jgi:hypothetical protein
MRKLQTQDLAWLVQRLPKDLLYQLKHINRPYVVAGGYIRASISKEKVSDIDIFATNKEDAKLLADTLQPSLDKQFITENAYSFTLDGRAIQVIHRWTFAEPKDIIVHFDFTVAQAAIWYTNPTWYSLASDTFYEDLAAKRLVYTMPPDAEPGSSLLRLLKFTRRGYSADIETVANIVSRTAKVDPLAIIADLREIDPLSVNVKEILEYESD